MLSDTCTWTEDDANDWDTSCDNCFIFNDGGPKDNQFTYCPYCGKPLIEKVWNRHRVMQQIKKVKVL